MYRIVEGSTCGLEDVEAFREAAEPSRPASGLRQPEGFSMMPRPLYVARAPGRLDVMGGIADYSGSLVLQLPIREATMAALQRRPERQLRIVSLGSRVPADPTCSRCRWRISRPAARRRRTSRPERTSGRDPATHWAAYAAGAFLVLMRERGSPLRRRGAYSDLLRRAGGQGRQFVGGDRSGGDAGGRRGIRHQHRPA